jgi:hypothetical protein
LTLVAVVVAVAVAVVVVDSMLDDEGLHVVDVVFAERKPLEFNEENQSDKKKLPRRAMFAA